MKLNKINTALLLMLLAFTVSGSIAFAAPDINGRMGNRPNPALRPEGGMGVRKDIREERGEMRDLRASTTEKMMERKEVREDRREERNASTSDMFKKMENERPESIKKMKKGAFEMRKEALLKELTKTLANLRNNRDRISARINDIEIGSTTKEQAMNALAKADDKLSKAQVAINTLASSTASTTPSDDVDLAKPRQIGNAAIKAVKDARDALKDVVKIIMPNIEGGKLEDKNK